MPPTKRQRDYWRQSLRLTVALLAIWFLVTVISAWFADSLNTVVVFGFPLGFYMGAQGSLIVYLLIIWYYGRTMNRRDEVAGVVEDLDD
jgi:putative solute:sodium symporter small subunit